MAEDLSAEVFPVGAKIPKTHKGRRVMGYEALPGRLIYYNQETFQSSEKPASPMLRLALYAPDWGVVVFFVKNMWVPIGGALASAVEENIGYATDVWKRRMPVFSGMLRTTSDCDATEADTTDGWTVTYQFTSLSYYDELDTAKGLPIQREVSGTLAAWAARHGVNRYIKNNQLWIGRGLHPSSIYSGSPQGLGLTDFLLFQLEMLQTDINVQDIAEQAFKDYCGLINLTVMLRYA